jgi:hypothetical protein
MQATLNLYRDFARFQNTANDKEEVSERFVSRCQEATEIALEIAKLRQQRAQVGFIPLPLGDYLRELGELAGVGLSRVYVWAGIRDINRIDPTSFDNYAWLTKKIGFSLQEVLLHARISLSERFKGTPVTILIARRRAIDMNKSKLEECESILEELEKRYRAEERKELRHITTGFTVAYRHDE